MIQLEGSDRHDFLQSLITNDIRKLETGKAVYACLLNPQGKFLHDFIIIEGCGFTMLDCEGGERALDLYKRLNMYRLRKDVQISVEEENIVYAVFGKSVGMADPRHHDMGFRTFEKPDLEEKPFTSWDERRIHLTIPDGSRDIAIERDNLLECRIDMFEGVSFDKGCYVGQEVTARIHHRGLVKKHLYTVTFEGKARSPFTDLENGGQMRSSSGQIGLALLKDEVAQTLMSNNKIIL